MMRKLTYRITLTLAVFLVPSVGLAQQGKDYVRQAIDTRAEVYRDVAMKIWDFAELGYLEEKSSALLQEQLRQAGFQVQMGLANIPTAFVASYGSGQPVIGILAEFDALPGLSQEAMPTRLTRVDETSGHACGHHLFGTASTAAAIALKDWLSESGTKLFAYMGHPLRKEAPARFTWFVQACLMMSTWSCIGTLAAQTTAVPTPPTPTGQLSFGFREFPHTLQGLPSADAPRWMVLRP